MAHSTAVRTRILEDITALVTNTGMPAKSAIREVAAKAGIPASTIERWYWPPTGAMNARRAKAKPQGSGPSVTPYDLISQQLDQGRSPEDIRAAFLAELDRQSKERGHQLATTPETVDEVATDTTIPEETKVNIDDLERIIAEECEKTTVKERTPDEIRSLPSPDTWVNILKKVALTASFGEKVYADGLTRERAAYDLALLAKEVSEQGFRAAL